MLHKEISVSSAQPEKNIVWIQATAKMFDALNPWQHELVAIHGSGFVMERSGKKYIVTNAHCLEGATSIRLGFAEITKEFSATVVNKSYRCDLALLEVADPEFNALAEVVHMGEMVALHQAVEVRSFAANGNKLATEKGIISHIAPGVYITSDTDEALLQAGMMSEQKALNGGPVFSDGKLVALSFQATADKMNYLIPMPIIEQFLAETLQKNIPRVLTGKTVTNKKVFALHDNLPSYLIRSGISFTPLTREYLDARNNAELNALANVTKQSLMDQIVVINNVLDAEATRDYTVRIDDVVTEINGKKINNMRDVKNALDNNNAREHCLVTGDGQKKYFPVMTKAQEEKLLGLYSIPKACSADLQDSTSLAFFFVMGDGKIKFDRPVSKAMEEKLSGNTNTAAANLQDATPAAEQPSFAAQQRIFARRSERLLQQSNEEDSGKRIKRG